ncbi:alpha/beta fold hydrolase [Streptomyces tauricus]|uniref:alpha/beta fold hydrolase n=1 Tax=Streptomyces tauricus TaxID=68274 RepID=UPI0022445F99|nr:alpha/beta fold hydrolase [Streptomyces tauricus]MCW8102563.1 hypothetical protein [Streptomyces tauricus]
MPGSARVLFQGAFANFSPRSVTRVDFRNDRRAPLLFIAGGADHIVPAKVNRANARLYGKSAALTDVFLSNRRSAREAAVLAATQRPVTPQALGEPSGTPAWETIPSWYLVAGDDHLIPAAAERFMAQRAHSHTSEVDAPHDVMLTNPGTVTHVIENAAHTTAR